MPMNSGNPYSNFNANMQMQNKIPGFQPGFNNNFGGGMGNNGMMNPAMQMNPAKNFGGNSNTIAPYQ